MKKALVILQLLMVVLFAQAQMMNPVKFTSSLKTNGTPEAEIVFTGKIQPGWHVYSTGLGGDGPISASFNVNKMDGAEAVGKLQPRGNEISKFDNLFGLKYKFQFEILSKHALGENVLDQIYNVLTINVAYKTQKNKEPLSAEWPDMGFVFNYGSDYVTMEEVE